MELKFNQGQSFHQAVVPILVTAQIFGLMPVTGISSSTPYGLWFKWRSIRTCFCFIIIFLQSCVLGLEILEKNRRGFNITSLSEIFFSTLRSNGI